MLCGDSDLIDRLVTYLTYSGIDAQKAYDEYDDSYALLVEATDRRHASHLVQEFLQEEKDRQETEAKKAAEEAKLSATHAYNSEVKAKASEEAAAQSEANGEEQIDPSTDSRFSKLTYIDYLGMSI